MTVIVYHNPRCSKSRETIKLLESQGIDFETRLYLNDIPSVDELKKLTELLGFSSAKSLLRTKEDAYKTLNLADETNEKTILEAMHAHPKLIERPIVVVNDEVAKIGRPPEQVLELFE